MELIVRAGVKVRQGRLFGASFALPDDYELLSVVGANVGDHYIQPAGGGRRPAGERRRTPAA